MFELATKGLLVAAAFSLAALCLAACASDRKSPARTAVTPTQLYPLRAAPATDQIAIALHPEGLSPAQTAALRALADRRREALGGPVLLRTPGTADAAIAAQTLAAARQVLVSAGVADAEITVDTYAANDAKAPLLAAFSYVKAEVPVCGKRWDDLTHTEDNRVQSNFGCAEMANMAAQIADPADIAGPQREQAANLDRRLTVLGKYAAGKVTSADVDAAQSSAVSRAVP